MMAYQTYWSTYELFQCYCLLSLPFAVKQQPSLTSKCGFVCAAFVSLDTLLSLDKMLKPQRPVTKAWTNFALGVFVFPHIAVVKKSPWCPRLNLSFGIKPIVSWIFQVKPSLHVWSIRLWGWCIYWSSGFKTVKPLAGLCYGDMLTLFPL